MASLLARLPRGASLSPDALAQRYRIVIILLYLHVPVLILTGLIGPAPLAESLLLPMLPLAFALGSGAAISTGLKCDLSSAGLMSATYVAIELTGGRVEAHFHLFVILIWVALYQRWQALALAIVSALVHHLVIGLIWPAHVFSGPGGHMAMSAGGVIGMAAYHVAMVVLEVSGILVVWYFAEQGEAENVRLGREALVVDEAMQAERQATQLRETQAAQQRSEQLAGLTQNLAGQAREIQARAIEITGVVGSVKDRAATLTGSVQDISERARKAASTADQGRKNASEAAQGVNGLARSMGEISSVNALISQLADQTNLLALNAAIEAARAGDQGRGFSVVANEVKALASETARSSGQVNTVITAVVHETQSVTAGFVATSEVVSAIHALQQEIAAAVEEQLLTLRDVSNELSFAADSSTSIAAAIERLTQMAADSIS